MTEQKLKELLADMTLEEKVNQMSQVVGAFFNKDMDITAMGPMADKGFTPENVALSGSVSKQELDSAVEAAAEAALANGALDSDEIGPQLAGDVR